jgi:hypothetical protein
VNERPGALKDFPALPENPESLRPSDGLLKDLSRVTPGALKDLGWPIDDLGELISLGLSRSLGRLNLLSLRLGEVVPNRSFFAFGSELDCLAIPSRLFEVDGLRRSSLRNCLSDLRSDLDVMEVTSFFVNGTLESPILP